MTARTKAEREGRTTAEWVTFALSCVVLLVVAGLILVQFGGTEDPPAPVAKVSGPVRETDGQFYVPVEVVNEGDVTVADVQVSAELTIAGEITMGDQTIAFLAGDQTEELEFVFDDPPSQGELVVRVSGYALP